MALTDLERVAVQVGASLAAGLLARARDLPKREHLIKKYRPGTLESVPGQILWEGLGEEAAPVFVVYKLIHEIYSNAPSFFRRSIVDFMRAQPSRFSTVFNRETIWSILAHVPGMKIPFELHNRERIIALLRKINEKAVWRRSEAEIEREAEYILDQLKSSHAFGSGFSALRQLQIEKATSFTEGKLMLFVPAKLTQFAEELATLGENGKLPNLKEIYSKVDEIVRDNSKEGRHRSVPIDILFTELQPDRLNCFTFARTNADAAERRELRVRLVLVRYFLRSAFRGYGPDQVNVQASFYLDRDPWFRSAPQEEHLFHSDETITFHDFWNMITGEPNGAALIEKLRDAAVNALARENLVALIKEHFRKERSPHRRNGTQPPSKGPALQQRKQDPDSTPF
jgi:hypothetical protein